MDVSSEVLPDLTMVCRRSRTHMRGHGGLRMAQDWADVVAVDGKVEHRVPGKRSRRC